MSEIRIKCPTCGARLTVIDSPSNQGKSVKCPVCKEKHLFSQFQRITEAKDDFDKTQIGGNLSSGDETELPDRKKKLESCYLLDNNSMLEYPLHEGINLVGRKTYMSPSVADVAIETTDRGFSRKHLYIEVSNGHAGELRFCAYNAENKNPTTINGVQIIAGDRILLHKGDVIKSSETSLVFMTR